MICALKHKKSGKYVAAAIGRYTRQMIWNGDKSSVQFKLTTDMLKARQIENPDMNMVLAYGLEAIPLKIKKAVLKQDYRIIEHGD